MKNKMKNLIVFLSVFAVFAIMFECGENPAKTESPPNESPPIIKTDVSKLSIGDLVAGIQTRSEAVIYRSETESDANVFVAGRKVKTLSVASFRLAAHISEDTEIEEFDAATLWKTQIGREETGDGWLTLKSYVESNLEGEIKVFKTGDVQRDVYIVGLFEGRIVGVKTFAVET